MINSVDAEFAPNLKRHVSSNFFQQDEIDIIIKSDILFLACFSGALLLIFLVIQTRSVLIGCYCAILGFSSLCLTQVIYTGLIQIPHNSYLNWVMSGSAFGIMTHVTCTIFEAWNQSKESRLLVNSIQRRMAYTLSRTACQVVAA